MIYKNTGVRKSKVCLNSIIFLVGPTAVGKTAVSLKVARRVNGEIISCDSMQVYKGMRILSQAPSKAERSGLRHHLVEILDPKEEYSAAAFRRRASRLISLIIKRKKIPLVVGGSGLYIKALVDGLFPSPEADRAFRKSMQKFADRYGSAALHKRLSAVDPGSASKIHPNDLRRIIRALEIRHVTGKTLSELKSRTKGLGSEYEIIIFGLIKSRRKMYEEINNRVDRMFEEGIVAEVKRLNRKRMSKTAKAAIGIREVSGYLDGEYDLDRARELLKQNTRRLAKKQLTWFRADKRIRWLDMDRIGEKKALKVMREALK